MFRAISFISNIKPKHQGRNTFEKQKSFAKQRSYDSKIYVITNSNLIVLSEGTYNMLSAVKLESSGGRCPDKLLLSKSL